MTLLLFLSKYFQGLVLSRTLVWKPLFFLPPLSKDISWGSILRILFFLPLQPQHLGSCVKKTVSLALIHTNWVRISRCGALESLIIWGDFWDTPGSASRLLLTRCPWVSLSSSPESTLSCASNWAQPSYRQSRHSALFESYFPDDFDLAFWIYFQNLHVLVSS